jgi:hypothetical protein
MTNATIRKVAPQESDADEEETQNTTHSGSDGGGGPVVGADAKILKKPGLGKVIKMFLVPFLNPGRRNTEP